MHSSTNQAPTPSHRRGSFGWGWGGGGGGGAGDIKHKTERAKICVCAHQSLTFAKYLVKIFGPLTINHTPSPKSAVKPKALDHKPKAGWGSGFMQCLGAYY